MAAVCESFVPTSLKVACNAIGVATCNGEIGIVIESIVGATFAMFTSAVDVTGAFAPSLADNVAVTMASSLHVTVGLSEVDPLREHAVPGEPVHVIDQLIPSGPPPGFVTVPCSVTGDPSIPAYGPPAAAVANE
jgi:hypothetical protein